MFAAIDFGVLAPGFFNVAAGLLGGVGGVEPSLQVAAAEFSFFVFFVAGALSGLLDLHLVVRKLRNILCADSGHFAGRQETYPSFEAVENAAGFSLTRSL